MDYKEMTLVELRELAREKGIGSITRYKKAELIDVLEKLHLLLCLKKKIIIKQRLFKGIR